MIPLIPTEIYQQIIKRFHVTEIWKFALVNKTWCANVIPILYKDPFSLVYDNTLGNKERKAQLAKTYLWCLTDDAKNSLKSVGIELPEYITTESTFKYESFLYNLNYLYFIDIFREWLSLDNDGNMIDYFHYVILEKICKEFVTSAESITYLSFINVNKIHLPFRNRMMAPLQSYICSENSFFSRIEKFESDESITSGFFFKMAQVAHKIEDLHIIDCHKNDEAIATLIKVQDNLHKISFEFNGSLQSWEYLEEALGEKVESLKEVHILSRVYLTYDYFSLGIFSGCTNLQVLKLHIYKSMDHHVLEDFAESSLTKLKTLDLKIAVHPTSDTFCQISRLITNSNTYDTLRNITIVWQYYPVDFYEVYLSSSSTHTNNDPKICIINTIIDSCTSITHLEITIPNSKGSHILNIFLACVLLQEVKFYTDNVRNLANTKCDHSEYSDISQKFLSFGENIPKNLRILCFVGSWKFDYFALSDFLDVCANRLNKKPFGLLFSLHPGRKSVEIMLKHLNSGLLDPIIHANNVLAWIKY
ncbi:20602_t:CDS:2 [Cetraspora pellucida]|uniref:20602_t:CDS:1 n=1 Tax=Cetraspora pellucida TaxID=1433469 RepID=A0A9N8ZU33_9GLOM|nr:20602_t:CDS:2 [Cetraspora pellucida]